MPSVGDLCPACKRPVADHLPSSRYAPREVPPGKVAVVNGRCTVAGERAPQKCCWVLLREGMTPGEYRERFAAGRIALEPCPCCGGPLLAWGSCPRRLVEGEGVVLQGLRLRRGRCPNPDCPVRTVTHYPVFVTPYQVVATAEREAAVRAHVVEGWSWSTVQRRVPWLLTTVQRWERRLAVRAAEVATGLLAVWQRLDEGAPAELRAGAGRRGLLQAMFAVCDAVGELLRPQLGWTAGVPGLALPRLVRPTAPTPLPVWA
jgi:hypothetical protein